MDPSHSVFKQTSSGHITGLIFGERAGGGGSACGLQRKPATPGFAARTLKCSFYLCIFKTQLNPWLLKTQAAPGHRMLQDFLTAERVGGVERS